MKKIGIALDIDETLCWTCTHLIDKILNKFGYVENLSTSELVNKYRYTFNVPGWEDGVVDDYVKHLAKDPDFMLSLSLMDNVLDELSLICEFAEVKAYISSREEIIRDTTKKWLDNNNFPQAEIYLKPESEKFRANSWKQDVLNNLYPEVKIFVDDSISLLNYISKDYKGHIIIFDFVNNLDLIINRERVHICSSWKEIREKIKEICLLYSV